MGLQILRAAGFVFLFLYALVLLGGWLHFPACWMARGRDRLVTPLVVLVLASFSVTLGLALGIRDWSLAVLVAGGSVLLCVQRIDGPLDRLERFSHAYMLTVLGAGWLSKA